MLRRFKDYAAAQKLFDSGDQILIAVSGGLDSMVLLDLFRESGQPLAVAHCNFQLRAEASDQDESFVREYCHKFGIRFFGKRFETKNYAEVSKVSIQMAARELRYAWFNEVLDQKGMAWIATAHHVNDNIETVLLRWSRGASLELLTGIPVKQGRIVRPLLFAKRDEILQYANAKKILWREDASNATDDYQRNFIRHQVIPRLKELNPSLEDTFADSHDKLKGAYELMQRGLEQLRDSMTSTVGNDFRIDKGLLSLLKNPVFPCYEWLKSYGFEWDRCVQMVMALDGQPGKQFLSATHQATIDREYIIVSPLQTQMNDVLLIEEGQDQVAMGPWRLLLKPGNTKYEPGDRMGALLNMEKLSFPLLWRKWRHGDFFYPSGLGHRKKVSDFLIDEKVPVGEKARVTVIESGGEIAWVVGYRIDDRFKAVTDTGSVLGIYADLI